MPDLPSVPKKRLALFLDGTWNVSDNTNVWRLRSLFAATGADGLEQRAYYSAGLGTKFGERIRGGMFGRGSILQSPVPTNGWLITMKQMTRFSSSASAGVHTPRRACQDSFRNAGC